jgi:hypothetical protein
MGITNRAKAADSLCEKIVYQQKIISWTRERRRANRQSTVVWSNGPPSLVRLADSSWGGRILEQRRTDGAAESGGVDY